MPVTVISTYNPFTSFCPSSKKLVCYTFCVRHGDMSIYLFTVFCPSSQKLVCFTFYVRHGDMSIYSFTFFCPSSQKLVCYTFCVRHGDKLKRENFVHQSRCLEQRHRDILEQGPQKISQCPEIPAWSKERHFLVKSSIPGIGSKDSQNDLMRKLITLEHLQQCYPKKI